MWVCCDIGFANKKKDEMTTTTSARATTAAATERKNQGSPAGRAWRAALDWAICDDRRLRAERKWLASATGGARVIDENAPDDERETLHGRRDPDSGRCVRLGTRRTITYLAPSSSSGTENGGALHEVSVEWLAAPGNRSRSALVSVTDACCGELDLSTLRQAANLSTTSWTDVLEHLDAKWHLAMLLVRMFAADVAVAP